jgi:hypothetical protein
LSGKGLASIYAGKVDASAEIGEKQSIATTRLFRNNIVMRPLIIIRLIIRKEGAKWTRYL